MSMFTRAYCLGLAMLFDYLHIEVVHNDPKHPTKEEVEKNIADFKEMIARGGAGWDQ